jgi:hypothetical protein
VLSEYIGYLAAQQQGTIAATSARPDAPVVPDVKWRVSVAWLAPWRAWLCAALHRIADRLEPYPRPSAPVALLRH